MKIGYLGPSGTFTEKAARILHETGEFLPYKTIQGVIAATNEGNTDVGVVPIQNSTEGIVNVTIDSLIFDSDLFIQSQLIIPIKQSIMINKNQKNKEIKKILSHPQALAQCRTFLNANYNNVQIVEVSSTAEAGNIISTSDEACAAICIDICADIYNLHILHHNIQDNNNNKTFFVELAKKDTSISPSVNTKMSIAFSTLNRPGDLFKVLEIFSLWDINITQISSRPMRHYDGEYVFYIDLDVSDIKDIKDAITMVKRKTNFLKLLGSYKVTFLDI